MLPMVPISQVLRRIYVCPFCPKRCWTLSGVLHHQRRCKLGRQMYENSIFKPLC